MTAPRPPLRSPGPPYVEVEPVGRWTWYGRVLHGIVRVDAFHAFGTRARADRIARRRLAKYLRDETRLARRQHRVDLP